MNKSVSLSAFAENPDLIGDECEVFSASADFAPPKYAEKIPRALARGASFLLIFSLTVPVWSSAYAQNSVPVPPNARATTTIIDSKNLPVQSEFTLSLVGILQPIVTKINEVATTYIAPYVKWKNTASQNLTPYTLRNQIIPYDALKNPNLKSALYCAKLTIQTPWGNFSSPPIVSTIPEISTNIPDSQPEMEHAKFFNTLFGRYRMQANADGKLDFNITPKVISAIDGSECGKQDITAPIQSAPINTVTNSSFGSDGRLSVNVPNSFLSSLSTAVGNIIPIQLLVELTRSTQVSNSSQYCHEADCTATEIDEETKGFDKTRGWTSFAIRNELYKEIVGAAGHTQDVKTPLQTARFSSDPDPVLNKATTRQKQADCSFTPHKFIADGTANIGGEVPNDTCTILPDEVARCTTTELPKLDKFANTPAAKCGLCHLDDLDSYVKRFGYDNIPPTMKKILVAAGNAYNVPASILLSILYSEGSLQKWQWTEENTIKWSLCGGAVESCEEKRSSTGATGPFSFLATKNNAGYDWSNDYRAAVNVVDPQRNRFSPCNFMDSAFAAAKKLWKESGGTGLYNPNSCWGHAFYRYAAGPSENCSWDPPRVSTGIRQYVGYCTEKAYVGPGGYSGNQSKTENHYDRAFQFLNAYSCP